MARKKKNKSVISGMSLGNLDDQFVELAGGVTLGLFSGRIIQNQIQGKVEIIDNNPILVGFIQIGAGGYLTMNSESNLAKGVGLGWIANGLDIVFEESGVEALASVAAGDLKGAVDGIGQLAPGLPTIGNIRLPAAQQGQRVAM